MKKLKVSLTAVTAIVLGICGSAFTSAPMADKATTLDGWFKYNGGDKSAPASYTYYGTAEPCNDVITYCAMKGDRQASPNQSHPTQSSINAAKSASSNFTIPVLNLVNFEP